MAEAERQGQPLRFGIFEADLQAGELRKAGVKLKLSGQPFQVLAILLERPGEVVTREELQRQLWPNTFVDVDHNLNTAINKIREALGDSAESPRYVETLPRRGYRFIAPVNGGGASSSQFAGEVSPPNTRAWRRPVFEGLAITGVVIVIFGALALWRMAFQTPGFPRVLRFTKLTNDGGVKFGPIVNDGVRIYFTEVLPNGHSIISQVLAEGGETTPFPVSLKQPRVLDLSKEGTNLLLLNYEGDGSSSIWLQPVGGGAPRRVGNILGEDARFGPDGSSIVYSKGHIVYSVSRDGSSSQELLTTEGYPYAFQFSPDTRVMRFTQTSDFHSLNWTLVLMEAEADGKGLRRMFPGCCGEWTPDGRFFVIEDRREDRYDLWVVPEYRSFWSRKQDRKATQLTAGPLNSQFPSMSKDGKNIFAIGSLRRSEVTRYDVRSSEFVPYLPGVSAEGLAFSPDGQWVAYTSYPEGLLWRSRVDGSDRLQLTFAPMRALLPRWSPDGKEIAFNATLPAAPWNIYMVSSEGGTPERILPRSESQMDANWSPDGNSLLFSSAPYSLNTPIYIIDLRSKRVSTLPGSRGLRSAQWSPDGRFIAALTEEAPQRLKLFDFVTQKWTDEFGSDTGYDTWSHDGKYIYFDSAPPNTSLQILRLRLNDHKVQSIVDVKNVGRLTAGTFGSWFGLAPDDSPLVARDISTQEIYALEMEWP